MFVENEKLMITVATPVDESGNHAERDELTLYWETGKKSYNGGKMTACSIEIAYQNEEYPNKQQRSDCNKTLP